MKLKEIITPFGKAGNVYLIGAITQGLAPVLLTPFLTRNISTYEFGQISVLNSISLIISIILTFGIPIVISRSYILEKSKKNKLDRLINQITLLYLIFGVIIFVIYKIFGHSTLLFISLGFIFAIYQIVLPTLRARNQANYFAIYSIVNTLLPLFLVLFFFNLKINVLDLFFFGAAISSVFGLVIAFRKVDFNLNKEFISDSIKTGLPILPHMLGMIALVNIDKVLFGSLKDEVSAGFLQVVMLIGLSPIFILSSLNHAWLNQILLQLKKFNQKSKDQINSTIKNLLFLCTFFIFIIYIFSGLLVKILNPNILFNSQIKDTIVLSSLSSILYVIYLANTHILTWSKKFWILGISTPISILFQGMTIFLLIDRFYYLSAAIAFGLAITIQILIIEIFNYKFKINNIIKPKYKLSSLLIFWVICAYFFSNSIS